MNAKQNASGQAGANEFYSTKSSLYYSSSDIEQQFRDDMQAAGIHYSGEIIADGNLHRFHIEGHKRGRKNGAYILHADGCPAGWFMDYKSGLSQTWKSSSGSRFSHDLTKQINKAKRQRELEIRQKHEVAAGKAAYIWNKSESTSSQSDQAYLINKRIQSHGTRIYRRLLVVPIHDESSRLINLQFISPEGEKRFLSGGRKRGCFHAIGDLSDRILICEGFATGASLFENCGMRVVIAFDAGNLTPVAKNIRELSPDSEIIICGDNDLSGIGQIKAKEAALAIGGRVLIPEAPGTDWNDVLSAGGAA